MLGQMPDFQPCSGKMRPIKNPRGTKSTMKRTIAGVNPAKNAIKTDTKASSNVGVSPKSADNSIDICRRSTSYSVTSTPFQNAT